MIIKDLIYEGFFESDIKGKTYYIYKFVDLSLYKVLYFSSTEKQSFIIGVIYKCTIEYQNDKFKITKVK